MSNETNNNSNEEFIETVSTTVTEETKPGIFGRFFNAVKNNPFKTSVAVVGAIGAGYVVHDRMRNGTTVEDVEEAVEVAVAAFRNLA